VQQAKAQIREAEINLARDRRSKDEMEAVLNQFDIYAPASGMVIYKRDWDGTKRTAGAEINPWDLTVATLPDLSTMISVTYVNEIDISKIKVGQPVRIGVDAFPEKKYSGEVAEVANIGQQLPNTDAKVFEVRIEMLEHDTILRPSMTSSNEIVTRVMDSVLFVPLEAVHADDSITYVYTRAGQRQIVVLGESNENHIIVEEGLKKGERLYLSLPGDPDAFPFTGLELIDVIKQKKEKEQKMLEQHRSQPRQSRPPGQRPGNMQTPETQGTPAEGEVTRTRE
jgi:HlyD family secretion protein